MSENINLYIDFENDYTKVTAIDIDEDKVLGNVKSKNAHDKDFSENLNAALNELSKITGKIEYKEKIACSDSKGKLKTIIIGGVEHLSTLAAKKAVLSSGAEVVDVYSKRLQTEDILKINNSDADIILLCGGTDGGNKDRTIYNSTKLLDLSRQVTIIFAGNKQAGSECRKVLESKFNDVRIADNVMPDHNTLNINSLKETLKEVFVDRVFELGEFRKVQKDLITILMPTSNALQNAARLLADGTQKEAGIGELMLIDAEVNKVEIFSVSKNTQYKDSVPLAGIPEPYEKRTIETDFDLNFEIPSFLEKNEENKEKNNVKINEMTYRTQIQIAVERHAGKIETEYAPSGDLFIQVGKNLTTIKNVVGTGSMIISSQNPKYILEGAVFDSEESNCLAPSKPEFFVDTSDSLYAFGLVATVYPDKALQMIKKHINKI